MHIMFFLTLSKKIYDLVTVNLIPSQLSQSSLS